MAQASEQEIVDETGNAFGIVSRHGGETAAAELMAAADPRDDSTGDATGDATPARRPARLGIADVS